MADYSVLTDDQLNARVAARLMYKDAAPPSAAGQVGNGEAGR